MKKCEKQTNKKLFDSGVFIALFSLEAKHIEKSKVLVSSKFFQCFLNVYSLKSKICFLPG
jgi:hypothetical protein